jgi:hypothetical protein
MAGQWCLVRDSTGAVISSHTGNTPPIAKAGFTAYCEQDAGQKWRDPVDETFKPIKEFGEFDVMTIDSVIQNAAVIILPAGAVVKGRDSIGDWIDTIDSSGEYSVTSSVPGPIVLKVSRAGFYRKRFRINAT